MYNQANVDDKATAHYSSSDIGSVAALQVSGFTLIKLDRTNPGRAIFIFKDSPELQATLSSYWSGELLIPAKQFFETTKSLKSRIYNT
jgi:hypothetical protein